MLDRSRPRLVLTFDLEDWHQIVHRSHQASPTGTGRIGLRAAGGGAARAARRAQAARHLLRPRHVRQEHPAAVRRSRPGASSLARLPTCPSTGKRCEDFPPGRRGQRWARRSLAGRRPVGYRAPAFSITRASAWAFELLSEHSASRTTRASTTHRACPTGCWESLTSRTASRCGRGRATGVPDRHRPLAEEADPDRRRHLLESPAATRPLRCSSRSGFARGRASAISHP